MKDFEKLPPLIGSISPDIAFKVYYNIHSIEDVSIKLNSEFIFKKTIYENPQKGFEMIFKAYYKSLCSHAVRFVYSKEMAEDIVEEVFLNFWKKQLYQSVTTSFRAYLYTAVRNKAYNFLQSEFNEKNSPDNSIEIEAGPVENNSPEAILLLDELVCRIEKTIHCFPPQCQKVFLLSRFEGKKNREIADELDIKLKTVEAHMMKALAALKKSLADYLKKA